MEEKYLEKEFTVDLTRNDFKINTYWTLCKFLKDDYTIENASSKRSLVGDFIDRWTNKAPETIIFDKLLEKEKYKVVKDNFIYTSSKAKNAPDILGLIDDKNKVYPFVKFDDDGWKPIKGMPFIEVKTFRSSQNLVTIPCSQFDEKSYFVILESNIPKDYILSLFANDFFDDENCIKMDDIYKEFIKSDENNLLDTPSIIDTRFKSNLNEKTTVGRYKLIGIFKKKDILDLGKKVKKGDGPLYFAGLDKATTQKNKNYDVNPPKEICSGRFYFNGDVENFNFINNEDNLYCDIQIENGSKLYITRRTSKTIDVLVKGKGKVTIDGELLEEGKHKLLFKKFSKDGKYEEFIVTKSLLRFNHKKKSSLDDLLDMFDRIVKN